VCMYVADIYVKERERKRGKEEGREKERDK
jgi:hypothetical protein